MQPWAEAFYRSKAWRQCRHAYFTSRHGLCERCGAGGKIVHHKIELTPDNINDPNVALNWDNFELLCQDCHNREHHETGPVVSGLRFDEDGNLIER
jgi:5-methylcytosine-specific restriction endonuclease McrA